jgi:pilus assembly protein CpaE
VLVVANKVVAGAQEVTRKDFEHSIERKVDIVLPLDAKAAAQSAKLGQPLARTAKTGRLAQPLGHLLTLTLEQASAESEAETGKGAGNGSLLGKLGNFKALVAKKPREASAQAA